MADKTADQLSSIARTSIDQSADLIVLHDVSAGKLKKITEKDFTAEGSLKAIKHGVIADGSTNVAPQLDAALALVPTQGGVLDIEPADNDYVISGTWVIADRIGLVIRGHGNDFYNTNAGQRGHPTKIKSAAGRAAGDPMIDFQGSSAVNAQSKGGTKFSGLLLQVGASGANGYGVQVSKTGAPADFWGFITFEDFCVAGGERGVNFAGGAGNNGYGWIRFNRYTSQGADFGIYFDATVNVLTVRDSTLRWCSQSADTSFTAPTGASIYLPGGTSVNIRDNDLEGSSIGARLSNVKNLSIVGNYLEAMYTGAFSLTACTDVEILSNYTATDDASKKIYLRSSRNVKQERNREAYFIVDDGCRDIITDTPKKTRFTVQKTGSTTLQTVDYGHWLHSIPMLNPATRPPKDAHYPLQSTTLTSATLANYSGRGPRGEVGKAVILTSTAASGRIELLYNTAITMEQDKFIVMTTDLLLPSTNTSEGVYIEVREYVNNVLNVAYQGTLPESITDTDEWFTHQWIHKCENSIHPYRVLIRYYALTSGDEIVFGGTSQCMVDSPAVDPLRGYFGDDDKYFLSDESGRFHSDASPADSRLVWADGEEIVFTDASAGSAPGSVCVTPGPGGTAVFKNKASLAA